MSTARTARSGRRDVFFFFFTLRLSLLVLWCGEVMMLMGGGGGGGLSWSSVQWWLWVKSCFWAWKCGFLMQVFKVLYLEIEREKGGREGGEGNNKRNEGTTDQLRMYLSTTAGTRISVFLTVPPSFSSSSSSSVSLLPYNVYKPTDCPPHISESKRPRGLTALANQITAKSVISCFCHRNKRYVGVCVCVCVWGTNLEKDCLSREEHPAGVLSNPAIKQ